jgi:hypothetical protein
MFSTPWIIRILSGLTTYFGLVGYTDRPQGQLFQMMVDDSTTTTTTTTTTKTDILQVRPSLVKGAGRGLFVNTSFLPKGTVLGTYPGVVLPLQPHLNKLRAYPQCETYIWRFSDSQMVIDPTNSVGVLDDTCRGGNPNMVGSEFLFQTIGSVLFKPVPTTLCRINEPPKGFDVNVITTEDLSTRSVTFLLERDVYEGEELFIDYGLTYDRSNYR